MLEGVDEYVFVGIFDPALKARMVSGEKDAEATWGQTDLVKAACKITLLWPCAGSENRVSGNMVAKAIRENKVPWPNLSWWKSLVVEGELLRVGLGERSPHNAGGGSWCPGR